METILNEYKKGYEELIPSPGRTDRRLKAISERVEGEREILDIGFNEHPNPYLKNPDGLDIEITKKPKNYNKLFKQNILSNNLESYSYDLVIASEVIEHMENPLAFLRELKRITRKRIIITTPSPYSLSKFVYNFLFPNFKKCNHLFLFTKRNMNFVAEILGLEITEYKHLWSWKQVNDLYVFEKKI